MPCEGVFIAIGHKPNTDLFKASLIGTKSVLITPGVDGANIPGVFACATRKTLSTGSRDAAGTGVWRNRSERYLDTFQSRYLGAEITLEGEIVTAAANIIMPDGEIIPNKPKATRLT